ncbi:hypothetical protein V493_07723, partial [Pseudogymnoascus sp. VKM F-4281 (FW-2241)]
RREERERERERERGDEYVYAPPREKRSPRRPEVRVVGCSESDGLSAVEEERDGPRRENRDERDREERRSSGRSSGHRRRRRLAEEERAPRHQSTASLNRSKTSSHRKESSQPLNFIRRTLSSASARPDSRPVLKRAHTTSSTHLPKKIYESTGPPQTPKRSIFLDIFTPAIKEEEPVKLSGTGSSRSTPPRTAFIARRGGAGSGSSPPTTTMMGKAMVGSTGSAGAVRRRCVSCVAGSGMGRRSVRAMRRRIVCSKRRRRPVGSAAIVVARWLSSRRAATT